MSGQETPEPCPFCGGKQIHEDEGFVDSGPPKWWCYCESARCKACGPVRSTQKEAIRAWNKAIRPLDLRRKK